MKNLIPIILSAIWIFCCGACGKSNQTSSKVAESELVDPRELDPAEIAAYDREVSLPFQGMALKDYDAKVITKTNDSLPLNTILDKDILYVRYSQYACGDCVTFLNSILTEYKTSHPSEKIRFLIRDVEMRDLHVWENNLGKRFEIFKVDSLPTDFDDALTTYVFKLDNNLNIRDYYIPRKELPDSLRVYLQTVTNN